MNEGGAIRDRAAALTAFRLATARTPSDAEVAVLRSGPEPAARRSIAHDRAAAEKLLSAGEVAARSGARCGRTGRLHHGRQRDPESGRGDHAGNESATRTRADADPPAVLRPRRAPASAPRRLASLLAPHAHRPPRACPACPTSRRRPSASSTCSSPARRRRWTCSTTSRSSAKRYGKDLPDSIRQGQRLTGMTSGQKTFPGGALDLQVRAARQVRHVAQRTAAAHREDRRRDLRRQSLHTEAINHDPAITFIQTGSQLPAGRASASWLIYGLGSENRRPAGVRRDDLARHRPATSTSRSTTGCGAAAFCRPRTRA